jgi:aryl-alcohol dehydrogenase-like predicted oxidoreductase
VASLQFRLAKLPSLIITAPTARELGREREAQPMLTSKELQRRRCGRTELELPVLGVGVWVLGGQDSDYWGGYSEAEARNLVAACLDSGANYFDVAEAYNEGRSEEVLGKILSGQRARAIIGTKVSPKNCSPATLREHCEASLRRLQTDYIDLYMVHWPIREHGVREAFETLAALRTEGKIRHVGVSNFGVRDLAEAAAVLPDIAINQLHYNLLSRAIEVELLPLCNQLNIGVMTYMSLLQGLLTGKYDRIDDIPPVRTRTRHFRPDRPDSRHGEPGAEVEVQAALTGIRSMADEVGVKMGQLALGWLASRPGVTCVLAGARDPEQLQSNICGATLVLPADVLAKLDDITRPLLDKLGSNPDYWQSGDNARIR